MTDILLIQPPVRDFYATAKRSIPYGLACIAASLLKHGFSVEILDGLATSKSRNIPLPAEMGYLSEFYGNPDISPFALFHQYKHFGYSFEHIGKQAKESGAFLVGISSLFTAYSPEALQTARIVKACHPSCKIVIGGHHPTALPEAVMACSAVDYGLRGEGEISLPILAALLKTDKSPSDALLSTVPGLVFRKSDGIPSHQRACLDEGSERCAASRDASGSFAVLPAGKIRRFGDCRQQGVPHDLYILLVGEKFQNAVSPEKP